MPITNYLWDPLSDNVLLETDETHATTATYTQEPDTFGNLISQHREDQTSWHQYDALGSTRQLTDATETVTDTNLYDAWGVNVESTGTTENPFRWVGESGYSYDAETQLYSVRDRVFKPVVGRWTSLDPLGVALENALYRYAQNDPVGMLDPSGLQCDPTTPGVNYRPGYGMFALDQFTTFVPEKGENRNAQGATFTLRWRWPFETNRYIDDDCCYCSKLGYIQVADYIGIWTADRSSLFSPRSYVEHRRSFVDGGVPYRADEPTGTRNPCNTLATTSVTFRDAPNAPTVRRPFPWYGTRQTLQYFRHNFETCVVCLEGPHGFLYRRTPTGSTVIRTLQGMTVYGCVTWSIVVALTSRGYVYHRSFMSTRKKDLGGNTVFPDVSSAGRKPSSVWWSTVKDALFITTPLPSDTIGRSPLPLPR